jgi:hypothetical protein
LWSDFVFRRSSRKKCRHCRCAVPAGPHSGPPGDRSVAYRLIRAEDCKPHVGSSISLAVRNSSVS